MFCPKCSQQQVSEEVRFCSRCGFSLGAVRELVVSGGVNEEEGKAGQLAPSQRNARKGAWLILASLAITLIVAFLAAIEDDFAVLLFLPLLVFVLGFLRVLYGVFLADKRAARAKAKAASQKQVVPIQPGELGAAARRPELSAPRVAPIERIPAPRIETAEMVRPPSVTENTTRLLDDESDRRRG